MKRMLAPLAVMSLLVLVGIGSAVPRSFAAEQTWTGMLTDATCGKSHLKMSQGQFTDKECSNACGEMGKYAIVADGTVITIANKDLPAFKELAAEKVTVTGELNKDKEIVATKVEAAK